MTGFARCEQDTEYGVLAWEARTVNHRHFDLSLRLPEECRPLESAIREAIGLRIRRGKLDVALHIRRSGRGLAPMVIDEAVLGQVVDALKAVAQSLGQAAPPNSVDLLRWPGVVREGERDHTELHVQVMSLLGDMLDDLIEGRKREGGRIAKMILARADEIAAIAASVRKRLPAVQASVRERLVNRVAELGAEVDGQRLEQELVIIAQRLDVAEELDRLDAHVAELRAIMQRDEPVGRRLDFLLQEFNREANTLGSKSQDTDTTRAAVDLKVLIEQVREQVQNLE